MPILIRNSTCLSFFLPPILHSFLKKYWVSVTCKASNTVGNNASCVLLSHILLFSCSVVSDSLQPYELQQARLPCPSLPPRAGSNSCPLSWRCHPTISSSVVPFSCPPSFPASGLFQWVGSLQQVAKVLEFQLQHQSFQWVFRTDFL